MVRAAEAVAAVEAKGARRAVGSMGAPTPAGMAAGSEAGPRVNAAWRLLYALALLVVMLAGLGQAPLFDVDEGAFSEATREMVTSGDLGHTTLNGEDRFDKPVGVYWLQSASVAVFGVREFAFRLPSALSGWLIALSLAAFAARRFGLQAGALAGVIAVSSLGWFAICRAATADGLLNLLIVLAGLDLWRFAESGARAPLRRAYAWVGLGLLVKGPVAALVPGAAFLLWVAASGQWARLRQAALDGWGWALLVGIAAPWYAYALHRHGMAFVEGFLLKHNVQRFSGPMEGHGGSLGYYVAALPLLAMPWAPLLAAVALRARGLWAEPVCRFLLGWVGFVLLFFSLSGTKLPHYVLYGYAPVVLLSARALALAGRRLRATVWVTLLAWALAMAWLPGQMRGFAASVADPLYRALIEGSPAPQLLAPAVAIGLIALLALAGAFMGRGAARREGAHHGDARMGAAGLVLALMMGVWAAPWWGEALQGPVKRAALAARAEIAKVPAAQAKGAPTPGAPAHAETVPAAGGQPAGVVQHRLHLPSVAVYLGQPVPRRDPLPAEFAITRADRLTEAEASRPRLFEERGVVLLGPQP